MRSQLLQHAAFTSWIFYLVGVVLALCSSLAHLLVSSFLKRRTPASSRNTHFGCWRFPASSTRRCCKSSKGVSTTSQQIASRYWVPFPVSPCVRSTWSPTVAPARTTGHDQWRWRRWVMRFFERRLDPHMLRQPCLRKYRRATSRNVALARTLG